MFNIHFTQTSIDHALQIMERLAQLPCAKPFLLPVEPIRDGVPNYYHVIAQPIDVSLINEKLLLMKYNFVHEWIRDMFLIRDNAKLFHGSNSFIYLLSRRLVEHFEHELKEFYIYNTRLWTKRYQEISKKLQDQMKQLPVILTSQGQSVNRVDQLLSQNISSLILNESQSHRSPLLPNNNISPKPIQNISLNLKPELANELPTVDLSEPVQLSQPNLIPQEQTENQLPPPTTTETNMRKSQVINYNDKIDTDVNKNDLLISKPQTQPVSIFQPNDISQTSIFDIGKDQKAKTSSIFGDIDPLSLPLTLPMGDPPPLQQSTSSSLPSNPTKGSNTDAFIPSKPSINSSQNPVSIFSNSSSIPLRMPQTAQQPIFPHQQFRPQFQQQPDSRHRTNLYGIINNIKTDPSTISPPEIGPIGNTKQNVRNDSMSPVSYIPESTMAASVTSTSSMSNMDMSSNFSPSFKFINSSKSPDQMTEQRKLFILHYLPLFNNFSDMFTLSKIISIHEPHYSFTNNEVDLAAIHPSTINELASFMSHRLNSSKSGINRSNNIANNNLDT